MAAEHRVGKREKKKKVGKGGVLAVSFHGMFSALGVLSWVERQRQTGAVKMRQADLRLLFGPVSCLPV